jgi:O-antigen/teichoic acid export membrane protein
MIIKLISAIISVIVGFYINLYFPLSIGIESFFTFSILMLFSNKFFEFFDIGSSATAFYIVIENKNNKSLVNTTQLSYVYFSFFALILLIISLFSYNFLFEKNIQIQAILFGAIYFYFIWISMVFTKFSDALNLTKKSEILRISNKFGIFLILISFHLLAIEITLNMFFILGSIVFLCSSILYTRILKIKFSFNFKKIFLNLINLFKRSKSLTQSNLIIIIVSAFDIYLLSDIIDKLGISNFNFFAQIGGAIYILSPILVPIFTRQFSIDKNEKILFKQISYILVISTLLFIPLAQLLCTIADQKSYFSEYYNFVYVVIINFSVLVLIRYLTNAYMLTGKDEKHRVISISIHLISLIVSFILLYQDNLNSLSVFTKYLTFNSIWAFLLINKGFITKKYLLDIIIILTPFLIALFFFELTLLSSIILAVIYLLLIFFKIINFSILEIKTLFKY